MPWHTGSRAAEHHDLPSQLAKELEPTTKFMAARRKPKTDEKNSRRCSLVIRHVTSFWIQQRGLRLELKTR